MDQSEAILSETHSPEFSFGHITVDTPEELVITEFEKFCQKVRDEIDLTKEIEATYPKSGCFLDLKMQSIVLWVIRRLARDGSAPRLDYSIIVRFYSSDNRYSSKYSCNLKARSIIDESIKPVTISQEFIEQVSTLEPLPPAVVKKRRVPPFGKSKLPLVLIPTRSSQSATSSSLYFNDSVNLLLASINDLDKLRQLFESCVREAEQAAANQKQNACVFFYNLAYFVKLAFEKATYHRSLADRGDVPEIMRESRQNRVAEVRKVLESLNYRLTSETLSPEDIDQIITALASRPSENLASLLLSGQSFFTDTEASNLLLLDKFGCCLLDYLVRTIDRDGRVGPFANKSDLLAAVDEACPQASGNDAFKQTSYYRQPLKADQAAQLWADIVGQKTIDRSRFESITDKMVQLLQFLADLKKDNDWMAIVAYTQGDTFQRMDRLLNPKTKVKRTKFKLGKKRFCLPDLRFKQGIMISRLVSLIVVRLNLSDSETYSFLVRLAEITKIPLENILHRVWIRFFSPIVSGCNAASVNSFLSHFEADRESAYLDLFKECLQTAKNKSRIPEVLSDALLRRISTTGDLEAAKRVFDNLQKYCFSVCGVKAPEPDSKHLRGVYPRFMAIALEESATLHSEVAENRDDNRQCFVDFLTKRYLKSLDYMQHSKISTRLGGSMPWISPYTLLAAICDTSAASGQSALHSYDWKTQFETPSDMVRLFPLQSESPEKIAAGVANFAILLRSMDVVFGYGDEKLELIARSYGKTFRICTRRLAALGEYVLGAAEACFNNVDILGNVYLPFMRGVLRSMYLSAAIRESLTFLVKFYEDPEYCNGIDEDFIVVVVDEVNKLCSSFHPTDYTIAVLEILPTEARTIDPECLKKLRILASSSQYKDTQRVIQDDLYKKPVILADLIDPSIDVLVLGSRLGSSSRAVLKEFIVHACKSQREDFLRAAIGTIIMKKDPVLLVALIEGLREKGITSFGDLLFGEIHSFYEPKPIEETLASDPKTNRDLVCNFWPSLDRLLQELRVLHLGYITSEATSTSASADMSLVNSLSAVSMDDLKFAPISSYDDAHYDTLVKNTQVYYCSVNGVQTIAGSSLVSKLEPQLAYLFAEVKRHGHLEDVFVSNSAANYNAMIKRKSSINLQVGLFKGRIHARFINGINEASDNDSFNLKEIKNLLETNRSKAGKKLFTLIKGTTLDERKILVTQLAKNGLLIYSLPFLVYFKPFLDILNQLAKSIKDFDEVYGALKKMVVPANATQAGYMTLNLHTKLIYRPYFYGDKPSEEIDLTMIAPMATRLGLALYFFAADTDGRDSHGDFLAFLRDHMESSVSIRQGIKIFFNELHEDAIRDSGNKRLIANLETIKELTTRAFSFGPNFDRSGLPNYVDYWQRIAKPGVQKMSSLWLTGQSFQISQTLLDKVKSLSGDDSDDAVDVLTHFSLRLPVFVLECYQFIESHIADNLGKRIHCSTDSKIKPSGIANHFRAARTNLTLPTKMVSFVAKGETAPDLAPNLVVIEVDAERLPVTSFKVRCSFLLQDKRVEFLLDQRAHPTYWEAETLVVTLANVTTKTAGAIGAESIEALIAEDAATILQHLKKAGMKERKFASAFVGNEESLALQDLDLCRTYFRLRNELRQHKANYDFGPIDLPEFN